jgi:nucleoside-diphosphate kinase
MGQEGGVGLERTYVMIKPDGVQRGLIGKIINRIEEKGLKIVAMKMNVISLEKAQQHYAEHAGRPFFKDLLDFITSGPSVSMVVEGKGAVTAMRSMNGATNPAEALAGTIRGDLGIDTGRNVVHGSDSPASAGREIAIHFGELELLSYTRVDEAWLY